MYVRKFLTSLLSSLFVTFLTSPLFAGVGEVMLIEEPKSTSFITTCSEDIECEYVNPIEYPCHPTDESLVDHKSISASSTVNESAIDAIVPTTGSIEDVIAILKEKVSLYQGPSTFVYPFVSVIKIQV